MNDQPDSESAKVVKQHEHINQSMLFMMRQWAFLETHLAMLLHTIIRDGNGSLASAIYFAPSAFEARKQIVEAALMTVCEPYDKDNDISDLWATWSARINKHKKVRNAVAHGTVSTYYRFGKNQARLMPPFFNFSPLAKSYKSRQPPGLSGNDIEASAKALFNTAQFLQQFKLICEACLFQKPEALPEVCLRLRRDLKEQ
jgi:hypothetical protein